MAFLDEAGLQYFFQKLKTVFGTVKTVNGIQPDTSGNVSISTFSIDNVYPVGSIYMSANATNPASLFGGTWAALDDGRVLIGAGAAYPAGSTGGEATHTLTTNEMPSHTHSGSTSTANLTGSLANVGLNYSEVVASGILSKSASSIKWGGSNDGSAKTNFSVNATHSHTMSLNNTGGCVA